MCGLFGAMSSYLIPAEVEAATHLGMMSVLRGNDATGLAIVCENKNAKKNKSPLLYHIKKAPVPSPFFLYCDEYGKILDLPHQRVIMGHTRAATIGEVNTENAHPHHFKHIIGSHNGTIRSFNWTEEQKKLGSDSRVLFHGIAEHGLEATLKKASWGAYAITYIDTSKGTLNFIRNSDRTLFLGYNSSKTTLYWASEKRFLEFIGLRDTVPLPTHTLFSFPIGQMEPKKTEFEQPKTSVVTHYHGHGHYHRRHNGCDYYGDWTKGDVENDAAVLKEEPFLWPGGGGEDRPSSLRDMAEAVKDMEAEEAQAEAKRSILALPPFRDGQKDPTLDSGYQIGRTNIISIPEAKHLLDAGCGWCQSPKALEDVTWWANEEDWYCNECYHRSFIKEYYHSHQLFRARPIRLPLA